MKGAAWEGAEYRAGWKMVTGFVFVALLTPAILFLAAGRIDWWEAWVMSFLSTVATAASRLALIWKRPDLIAERARWINAENTQGWDRVLMPIVAIYGPVCLYAAAGLDARWQGSPPLPSELKGAAFCLIGLGYALATWALLENRFFSSVARIQTERAHVVVTTGPYGFVRHPGYAGSVAATAATPLALGALWAYIPAFLTIAAIVVRTALEDRMLRKELPGYAAYAARTRYRLIPGVW